MSDNTELKLAAQRIVEVQTSQDVPIGILFDQFEALASPEVVLALIAENKSLRGNCKALGKSKRTKEFNREKRKTVKLQQGIDNARESILTWIQLHDDRIAENDQLKAENDQLFGETERLKAENGRLKMEIECAQLNLSVAVGVKNSQQSELHEAKSENEALREEIEHSKTNPLYSTRANSRRYVWLRDNHIGDSPESINLDPGPRPGLNSSIDAAMGKGEQS